MNATEPISNIFNTTHLPLVRIYRVNAGQMSGMGLLFSDKHILTCSHVVTGILNEENKIDVDFPYSQFQGKLTAEKVWSNPENGIDGSVVYLHDTQRINQGEDIAILEIEKPDQIPTEIKPFQLIEVIETEEIKNNALVRIKGYPQGEAQDITVQGNIETYTDKGWIQINGQFGHPGVQAGYSGSPVWNQRLQTFMGITIAIFEPDENNGQATTSFMIPNSILKKVVPGYFHLFNGNGQENIIGQYSNIIDQLRGPGLVIPFIGPRINLDFYRELEDKLIDEVGQRILGQNEWNTLNEKQKKMALIEQLIGIPWPECPYLIHERPGDDRQQSSCPVIHGLEGNAQELNYEQDLSVIKRNIRYLSLYFKMWLDAFNTDNDERIRNFYSQLTQLFPTDNDNIPTNNDNSSKFYEFLARFSKSRRDCRVPDLPFKLIITSNFDVQLTRKFNYYEVPYDLVFYVADGSEKGKFKHKSPDFNEIHLIETEEYDEFKIGERPIILQLYGRWDKNLTHESIDVFKNNFFVIDQIQFNGLLNSLKNLPNQILEIIKNNHVLFVGCNSNDYELQMIIQQLYMSRPSAKSWLMTHKQLGNSRKLAESIWDNFNTEIKPIGQTIEEFSETLTNKMIPN
ncbi:MAG: serine protease [Crocosphaera sp.]|nr:serine protease [Crocosphaera sp.]